MSHQPVNQGSSNGNVINNNHTTTTANHNINKESPVPAPHPTVASSSSLLPAATIGAGTAFTGLNKEVPERDDSLTPPPPPPRPSQFELEAAGRKRKWSALGFNDVEQESMERTTTGFHLALAQDQLETLFPAPPAAFTSTEDAIQRLLPYHIWQTCDEELEGFVGEDAGKRTVKRAREEKDAADTLSRMTKINERFMKLRTLDAQYTQRPSPTADLIYMIKESTAVLREELSAVQAELKVASAERNAIEMHQRAKEIERLKAQQAQREQEERKQAAMVAANTQHGSASTPRPVPTPAPAPVPAPAAAAAATPRAPPPKPPAPVSAPAVAPFAPPAPASAAAPTPIPPQASASTASPAQATPARGRGRPKGSLGARNQAAQAQAQASTPIASNGTPANTAATPVPSATSLPGPSGAAAQPGSVSSKASPTPAPSASGTPRTTRATAGTSNGTPTGVPGMPAGPMKGPVSISVPISAVPELLRAEVLSRDTDAPARAPASITRKTEDKKAVVLLIDLSRCSPKQLVTLAKILKVDTHKGGGGSGGTGTRDAVAQAAAPSST